MKKIPPTAEDARQRLLNAGLRLFAQQGFARTSTRELADAANVNVAAISYYFGDKAGLYRATFIEPMGDPKAELARFADPALTLAQALRGLMLGFVEPLQRGDDARLCMKLHFREWLEPTGLWQEAIERGIQPMHDALLALLVRHLGLPAADRELERLAIGIEGLGVQLHLGYDITRQLSPTLHEGPQALTQWTEALARYALALVQAEAARRGIALAEGETTT